MEKDIILKLEIDNKEVEYSLRVIEPPYFSSVNLDKIKENVDSIIKALALSGSNDADVAIPVMVNALDKLIIVEIGIKHSITSRSGGDLSLSASVNITCNPQIPMNAWLIDDENKEDREIFFKIVRNIGTFIKPEEYLEEERSIWDEVHEMFDDDTNSDKVTIH